jgi:inhibitor of cysteine peptidase
MDIILMACSVPIPESNTVIVDKSMHSDVLDLSIGEEIAIVLPGNPTTGYEWVLVEVDESILEKVGDLEYQFEDVAIGTGGVYKLRLKAVSPGESRVGLHNLRLWESEPVDQFEILVKVR